MEDRATLRSDPSVIPGLREAVCLRAHCLFYCLPEIKALNLVGGAPVKLPVCLVEQLF